MAAITAAVTCLTMFESKSACPWLGCQGQGGVLTPRWTQAGAAGPHQGKECYRNTKSPPSPVFVGRPEPIQGFGGQQGAAEKEVGGRGVLCG